MDCTSTGDPMPDGRARRSFRTARRLLGLLWSVLDGTGPLLLEEPELSLHEAVVRHLPAMMWKATRKSRRQVLLRTHSAALLSDKSIGAEEVLLLRPTREDTTVTRAADSDEVRALLDGGMSVGEAVLPRVVPPRPERLLLKLGEEGKAEKTDSTSASTAHRGCRGHCRRAFCPPFDAHRVCHGRLAT